MPKQRKSGKTAKRVVRLQELKTDGGCEGECAASVTVVKAVKGKCPNPCDPKVLKALGDAAKKKAKAKADKDCKEKDPQGKCACAGTSEIVSEGCTQFTLEDCGDVCIYYSTAAYAGECHKPESPK
jgi:hypothetical protein